MFRILSRLGLPLLAKELIEQSARKRTYVLRVLYAMFLYFLAFVFFHDILRVGAATPAAVLGRGREMFTTLLNLQFVGIYLFMPAITCGVLTQEKERASLQLLFLTRLTPWTILFEKLLGRLIPMLLYVFFSLPLLAFAYTLGGISRDQIWKGLALLVLASLFCGTLALMCSAYFRTTSGAFIWSYLLGALLLFGPAFAWIIIRSFTGVSPRSLAMTPATTGGGLPTSSYGLEAVLTLPLFGPALTLRNPFGIETQVLGLHAACVLSASTLFISLARRFVFRRAFLAPGNVVLNVFRTFDRVFLRLNNNPVTRNIVFVGESTSLPADEPVAWRETTKRSLGIPRYLMRVFIALEIPVATICLIMIFDSPRPGNLSSVLILVWFIAVLIVSAQSASLIAGERSHQTLEVLCVTPLDGRQIILQKYRAAQQLMMVLLAPFCTLFVFECAMRWRMPGVGASPGNREFSLPLYLTCSFLSVGIYLPLAAWLSLFIGLKVRTQARAIVASLAALVGWCLLPIFLVTIPLEIVFRPAGMDKKIINALALLSPATIIPFNEMNALNQFADEPWLPIVVNFALYGTCLVAFRWKCLSQADQLLGRLQAAAPATTGVSS